MNDKRKQQMILGASLSLLALFLTGCGGNNDEATPAPTLPPKAAVDAGGAATPVGGTVTPTPGGMKTAGQPGGVFSNSPGAAAPNGTADGKQLAANLPFKPRRDPFKVDWIIPPPPPNIFNEVQPLRVATYNVVTPPAPNTEVREVPTRRVSGIMSGDGVFAILESGSGDPEIVKPGAETLDGYKVVSINSDSVKLQKKEGNLLRTQIVPLSDIPTNPSTGGGGGLAGRMGSGSMGGVPGMGPSSSGVGGIRPGGGKAGGGIGD